MSRGFGRAATVMLLAVVGSAGLPPGGAAQTGDALQQRIAETGRDRVAFRFAVDDDVAVCENGFRRGDDADGTHWGRNVNSSRACPGGPLEVVVLRSGAVMREIDMGLVGDHPHDVDLGEVDPSEASAWLLSLHARGAPDDVAEEAMVGVVVARGVEPAAGLLELARDRQIPGDVRRSALFWVSNEAARGIDSTLVGIAGDEAEDQEVRDAAIFALSRRPSGQSIPALMELARSAPHAQTRRSALFWLSQSDDDRVTEFFAELILGDRGGSNQRE